MTQDPVDVDRLLAALERASTLTPWTSGGSRWQVRPRPLLPDETGCEDLLPGGS